ncbi:MAG: MBL fold metallo-hydrolase [Symploca sp. SIO3C6]|uniref:MBL fold metallo-hydrolase n=1 Tax=Symploca sp. SIO1C4 TaxID=2607765 RepID=A0A6B3NMB9_9CYAN|nr:MBL fold metallo-hydrolase [Symploca sp. SIO3C6]NER30358.1 MBL fold metallo-hydrolase [Symploca sp. SIO1C4]NET04706.1 MBL fold metallo-hydrolase [Symploca sp. SIO2B6]
MPDFEPAAPNSCTSNTRADMVTGSTTNFIVQFWGVRSQISAPGNSTIRYGGNTSCIEMRVGKQLLIFDGGSGLRLLGNNLLKQMPIKANIFFSHCYWDSIQGFPFFTPAFIAGNCFHIYGAATAEGESIEYCLNRQMLAPNFPVPLKIMQSELRFHKLISGNKIFIDDVTVETLSLNCKQSSMGYRVTWQGRSVVYATNRSLSSGNLDNNLLHLARQADLLILDAPFAISADEAEKYDPRLWQDQLWQVGMKTAQEAGVKRVVISRYNPDHDDNFLDLVQAQVQSILPNHILAHEGMILPVF